MMEFLKNVKWKHYVNYIAITLVLIIFSSVALAGGLPQSTAFKLEEIAISIILGCWIFR